jgi:hypothetical protein
MKRITVWTIFPVLMLLAAGCTLKGTVKQITDTTSNVTGTTSGHAWWNEDGLLLPEHKAMAFATYNEANLEQDVARGQGEYLTSMGTLLGVASDAQPTFQTAAQERFSQWGPADQQARLAQLRAISR